MTQGIYTLYPQGIHSWKLFVSAKYKIKPEDIKPGKRSEKGPLWARRQKPFGDAYHATNIQSPFGGWYHFYP